MERHERLKPEMFAELLQAANTADDYRKCPVSKQKCYITLGCKGELLRILYQARSIPLKVGLCVVLLLQSRQLRVNKALKVTFYCSSYREFCFKVVVGYRSSAVVFIKVFL